MRTLQFTSSYHVSPGVGPAPRPATPVHHSLDGRQGLGALPGCVVDSLDSALGRLPAAVRC
jgi:hypothetical protein